MYVGAPLAWAAANKGKSLDHYTRICERASDRTAAMPLHMRFARIYARTMVLLPPVSSTKRWSCKHFHTPLLRWWHIILQIFCFKMAKFNSQNVLCAVCVFALVTGRISMGYARMYGWICGKWERSLLIRLSHIGQDGGSTTFFSILACLFHVISFHSLFALFVVVRIQIDWLDCTLFNTHKCSFVGRKKSTITSPPIPPRGLIRHIRL